MKVRAAVSADLPRCQAVWEATAGRAPDDADRPEPNPLYAHELATGALVVAEDDRGVVVGFGASLDRPGRWYLADLFVEPGCQAGGVGRALLDQLVAGAPARRITLASDDRRGQALYAGAGMVPRWPVYYLRGPLPAPLPTARLQAEPMATPPPTTGALPAGLAELDRALTGVDRPQDLAWWRGANRATPLWLRDETGGHQGYAFVRPDCPWAFDPLDRRAATIVTVQVRRADLALDGVLAALGWAATLGTSAARLLVPGPHPALRCLLGAGFRIVDADVLCASHADLFDPEREIPSATVL